MWLPALSVFSISFFLLVDCKNVLVLPWASVSHMKSIRPYAEDIARAGHNVLMLLIDQEFIEQTTGSLTTESETHGNLRIVTWKLSVFRNKFVSAIGARMPSSRSVWTSAYFGEVQQIKNLGNVAHGCVGLFNSEFLKPPLFLNWFRQTVLTQSWDLVIMDGTPSLCTSIIASLIQAPHLIVHTTFMSAFSSRTHGVPNPPSYVPGEWSASFDSASFSDRCCNLFTRALLHVGLEFLDLQVNQWALLTEFSSSLHGDTGILPLALHIFWPLLDVTRPQVPGIISVYAPPLLADSFDDAHEVRSKSSKRILAAFGHNDFWSTAPQSILSAFNDAFIGLGKNVTVFWQLPDATAKNVTVRSHSFPIRVKPWWPQADMLCGRTEKVDVFITHGGAKSVHEALFCGVPMLVIPLWADEAGVAVRVKQRKAGIVLSKMDISVASLQHAIAQLLMWQRRPVPDVELAQFETYVSKHWFAYAMRHSALVLGKFYYPTKLAPVHLYFVPLAACCAACALTFTFALSWRQESHIKHL